MKKNSENVLVSNLMFTIRATNENKLLHFKKWHRREQKNINNSIICFGSFIILRSVRV